jgi:hypothetical protein
VIWHRYVTHDQYLAWRLGFLDTLIPMVFALLQMLLALSIGYKTFYFSLIFAILYFWGFIAYTNAVNKHDRPDSELLYKEHFHIEGDQFAHDVLWAVKGFEKGCQVCFFILTVIFTCITLFIHFTNLSEEIYSLIVLSVCSMTLSFTFTIDLRKKFKSTEGLKKFHW